MPKPRRAHTIFCTVVATAAKSTPVNSPEHLPKNFMDAYWRWKQQTSSFSNEKKSDGNRPLRTRPTMSYNRRRYPILAGRGGYLSIIITGWSSSSQGKAKKISAKPQSPSTINSNSVRLNRALNISWMPNINRLPNNSRVLNISRFPNIRRILNICRVPNLSRLPWSKSRQEKLEFVMSCRPTLA